jgi:hypothetical protein
MGLWYLTADCCRLCRAHAPTAPRNTSSHERRFSQVAQSAFCGFVVARASIRAPGQLAQRVVPH